MLFKGTEKRGVGEIARVIESSGGDINAFTSFDETVYYVVIASRFAETALDVLSDAVTSSTFDPQELSKELEVVLEEIRRGEDSPSRVLSQKMFAEAYKKHSYKRPVIGTSESVKSFTRDKILNFYKKWYSPDNMVLVVVGDFNKSDIKDEINETFGKISKTSIPRCEIPKEPLQEELNPFVISKDIKEGYFALAFHGPEANSDDTPVLDVLSNILGGGESSRLYRKVKEEKGVVNSIYSYAFTPKDPGLFVIGGTLKPQNAKEALKEALTELYKLKSEKVSTGELEKAKVNIESDTIYTKETMQGQAQKLGFFEVETGDYFFETEYLEKVSNVSAEDVIRVANKYFNNSSLTPGFLLPSDNVAINVNEIRQIAQDISASLNNKPKKDSPKQKEEVFKTKLGNGITLLVKENHATPIFAARAVFLGGVRFENEKNNGISNILSDMFTRGTDSRTAEDIAVEVESLAAEIEGFSGRNSIGVAVESLSKNYDKTMDIFADVILNPSFPEQEIERARREILSNINRRGDNPIRTAINTFLSTLYTKHPYRFDTLGKTEIVENFHKQELQKFYKKYINPENMVIAVAGDVDTEKVVASVKKHFSGFNGSKLKLPKISAEKPAGSIRESTVSQKDKAQAHILLGFLAPDLNDDDQYAFEILNTVLAGQGGRLFTELRDMRSLAYSVTSFYTPGLEPGYFGVYIGTAPQKEKEAIDGMKEQLELLLDKGITKVELERAQNYLVGNFEIGLQQNSAQAARIAFDEIYGQGWDEYKRYPDKIMFVTRQDVLRVAKKYIDLSKYTITVLRPESRI
jgi:zinc protease